MSKWMQSGFAVVCVIASLASGIVSSEKVASSLANAASAFGAMALVLVSAELRQSGKRHDVPFLLAWVVIVGRCVAIFRDARTLSGNVIALALLGVEAWLLLKILRSLTYPAGARSVMSPH